MKENIENSIKQSLENYELPYNADAWKAMSAKLDVVQPVAKPHLKWYIAATAAALISTCAYLYYSHNDGSTIENPNNEIAQNNETTTTTDNSTDSNNEQKHSNPTFSTTPSDQSNDQDENTAVQNSVNDVNSSDQNASNGSADQNSNDQNNQASNDGGDNSNSHDDNAQNDKGNDQDDSNDAAHDFVFISPTIDNICQAQRVNVNNQNDVDITVVYPNGLIWTGKAKSNTTLNPSVSGLYLIGYNGNDEFVKEGSFNVLPAPNADFSFIKTDERFDEKGLPSTFVSAEGPAQSYEWKMGESFLNGKEATGHLFREGNHDVTLTVTDENGCQASQTKTVTIEDKYNLMAMNSFVPTDIDPANNRFMPYSLTVRGDAFHMIIIDPADGHVIYETRDASKGWDGVDKQTGSMVKFETAYIWKVTLEDRKVGESPEYAGTVIPLASRR